MTAHRNTANSRFITLPQPKQKPITHQDIHVLLIGGSRGIWTPPSGFLLEPPILWARLAGCNRSALQLVINFSKPTRLHSCATGARDTTKLYYTPSVHLQNQFLACRRARFLRRSFFLRHFHLWLPDFFQAREPLFMVNNQPTNMPYMRASGDFM